jgi:hypothetical protein
MASTWFETAVDPGKAAYVTPFITTIAPVNVHVTVPIFELKTTKPLTVAVRFPLPEGDWVMVKVKVSVLVQTAFLHFPKVPTAKLPNTAVRSGVVMVCVVPLNVTGIRPLMDEPLELNVPVVVYVTLPATASCGTSNATAANSNAFLDMRTS